MPGTYHVTLRFIGEVDEGAAADIDAGARCRLRAPRFELALAGVGHFGTRMLWAGVERNPALEPSAREGRERASCGSGSSPRAGAIRRTSRWRGSRARPSRVSRRFLAEHALFRAEPFAVERFSLIASYLTKSGAIYEDQADYPLR